MSANRSRVRNEFTNRKKLVKNLARKEASSFCRQQVANVTVFVPFTHTKGRSQDFSKGAGGGGGHTVPKRGYSPDFHVVSITCCTLFAQNMAYKGGSRAPHDPPGYAPDTNLSLPTRDCRLLFAV